MLSALEKSSENLKNFASKGSPEWAKEVRKRAKVLVGQIDTSYMDLAEVLWDIHATPAFGDPDRGPVFQVLYKYNDFGQFCEEELGINKTKAQRLLRIWQTVGIELAHIDPTVKGELIAQGISKVRELIRVINSDNVSSWVEKAKTLSYPKLCQAVSAYADASKQFTNEVIKQKTEALNLIKAAQQGAQVDPEALEKAQAVMAQPNTPEITIDPKLINPDTSSPINFSLYPEQKDTVMEALTAAQKMTGSVKKSHNLTMICMDFLASNLIGDNDNIVAYLAKLEGLLGLKLIAIDSDNNSVVYGAKHL